MHLDAWSESLCVHAKAVDDCRREYMEIFQQIFQEIWSGVMPGIACPEIVYERGWDAGVCYMDVLNSTMWQDRKMGYTTQGPHRADIKIRQNGTSIFHFFSQGQQKSLMFALKIAQGLMLKNIRKKEVIYLIDDLLLSGRDAFELRD